MKTKKLSDKIVKHASDIIFGILAGSGLILIIGTIIALIRMTFPILQPYSTVLYLALYLSVLLSTSIYFSKGWFRVIYLISASILLIIQIFIQILL